MDLTKQVDKEHYTFEQYWSKQRWISLWYQLETICQYKPERVLEVGPGGGVLKVLAQQFGVQIETLDIASDLQPDHVADACEMPFADMSYDLVCSFQVLEHMPYEISVQAFSEMMRVSKQSVIISLPDAQRVWRYQFHVPGVGPIALVLPIPKLNQGKHAFDGQHYWEVNKIGYPLKRVLADFSKYGNLYKTFRVAENPYHRFFIFDRKQTDS